MAKEIGERALEAIEVARTTGKIKKGTNEATKAVERGVAKLVVFAKDVSPAEIVMHLPALSKERGVPCVQVNSKADLGNAAGISVPTGAVAVIDAGDADRIIKDIASETGAPAASGAAKETKEEKK